MSCRCDLTLLSKDFDRTKIETDHHDVEYVFKTAYTEEKYNMHCNAAVNFLKQLNSHGTSTNSDPDYKVKYRVIRENSKFVNEQAFCDTKEYQSPNWETPQKAAAKIDLFVNRKFMLASSDQKLTPFDPRQWLIISQR